MNCLTVWAVVELGWSSRECSGVEGWGSGGLWWGSGGLRHRRVLYKYLAETNCTNTHTGGSCINTSQKQTVQIYEKAKTQKCQKSKLSKIKTVKTQNFQTSKLSELKTVKTQILPNSQLYQTQNLQTQTTYHQS